MGMAQRVPRDASCFEGLHAGQAGHGGARSAADAAGPMRELPDRLDEQDLMRLATLGLMSAGIAHDMGNLLQVIASAVRLIDRRLDEDARAEFRPLIQGALTAVDRATTLRRHVLDLAPSEPAAKEIIFVGTTVAAIRDLIGWTVGPFIELEVICADDTPAVICNGRELENAILNLVVNAKDAMPHGGRLTLCAYRDPGVLNRGRGGGAMPSAVLSVSDTGCGMSSDIAGKVFRPFFTTKGKDRGTGLGLAMVSDFVRRAGGSAEIESLLGEGTTVTLRLPGCQN